MRAFFHLSLIGALLSSSPAWADDTATKTGLIVGLGLNAAKGQTTLANGAGAIEAGVSNVAVFAAAARTIIAATDAANAAGASRRPILLAAHDQQVDLVSPLIVERRIAQFRAAISPAKLLCDLDR